MPVQPRRGWTVQTPPHGALDGSRPVRQQAVSEQLARKFDVAEHRVIKIDLRQFGRSALTADIAVPKDRAAAVPTLDAFLRDMKASGFVASALARSGHGDVTIPP